MANALPQAIGAQIAIRKQPVISFSGDGGLAMMMGELAVIAATELAGLNEAECCEDDRYKSGFLSHELRCRALRT